MDNYKEDNRALVESLITLGILKTPRVIEAFLDIPRHLFIRKKYLPYAYSDVALPSLGDQTISQPYTVATMLEALSADVGDNVLDIGSGTGWTTSLLAKIVGKDGRATGIDIEPQLVEFAKSNISKIGLKNLEIILDDGKNGYFPNSPYDCILINVGCDNIPEMVIDQVKLFGRIVAPINSGDHQEMCLFQKIEENDLTRTNLGNFVFVKMK